MSAWEQINDNFRKHALRARLNLLTDKNGQPVGITAEQLDIYSKLIVQECAKIVAEDPFYASFAAKAIKDHFGVK